MAWGAIIGAVGSLASGALSYAGGAASNAATAAMTKDQMAFQQAMLNQQQGYNTNMVAGQNAMNWDMFNAQNNLNQSNYLKNFEWNENVFNYQRAMNDYNYAFQREMFNAAMQYDTEMSSTAYQRAMRDMRSAGLNPILAYQQGGASSPTAQGGSGGFQGGPGAPSFGTASGHAASVPGLTPGQGARAEMRDIITPAISSALQGMRAVQGVEQVSASIDQTKSATEVARAQADNIRAETILNTARGLSERERPELLRSETMRNIRQANLDLERRETERLRPGLVGAETSQAFARANSATAEARRQNIESTHLERWGRASGLSNLATTGEQGLRRIYEGLRELYQHIR